MADEDQQHWADTGPSYWARPREWMEQPQKGTGRQGETPSHLAIAP